MRFSGSEVITEIDAKIADLIVIRASGCRRDGPPMSVARVTAVPGGLGKGAVLRLAGAVEQG